MYSIKNLAKTKDGETVSMPFSPGTLAKSLSKYFGGQFDGLGRVYFKDPYYYQVNDNGELTGFDHLLLNLKYRNAQYLIFLIDLGTGVFPIGTYSIGDKINDFDLYPDEGKPRGCMKFIRELPDEKIIELLQQGVKEVKIIHEESEKQKEEKPPQYIPLKRLSKWNGLYDRNIGLTQEDADIVNRLIHTIKYQQGQNMAPCPGDWVNGGRVESIYTDAKGIKKVHVCEQGCSVRVGRNNDGTDYFVSISGGPFSSVPIDRVKYQGYAPAMFWAWGKEGGRAGGGLYFRTTVRNFESI